jgi:hypothetical protein
LSFHLCQRHLFVSCCIVHCWLWLPLFCFLSVDFCKVPCFPDTHLCLPLYFEITILFALYYYSLAVVKLCMFQQWSKKYCFCCFKLLAYFLTQTTFHFHAWVDPLILCYIFLICHLFYRNFLLLCHSFSFTFECFISSFINTVS